MADNYNKWKPKANDESTTDLSKEFNTKWITNGIDEKFIVYAEKVGQALVDGKLTTSKIRNIYSEIKRIQIQVSKEKEFSVTSSSYASFLLLKAKVAYTEGREKNVIGVKLFKAIFDKAWERVVNDENKKTLFENFCKVMEAILAYHRSKGGK